MSSVPTAAVDDRSYTMLKSSRNFAFLLPAFAMLALSSCATGEQKVAEAASQQDADTVMRSETLEEPPETTTTSTSVTTTTLPVLDAADELNKYVNAEEFRFSSGLISTDCGDVAVVGSGAPSQLLLWAGDGWLPNQAISALTSDWPDDVESLSFADLTNDGNLEIIVNLAPRMRDIAYVLTADPKSCIWDWIRFVDAYGDTGVYESLYLHNGDQLAGSGFAGNGSGRSSVSFRWDPYVRRLVAGAEEGTPTCREFVKDDFSLPLGTCHSNWAVRMAQEVLADEGHPIDVDSYFGSGTQTAVLHYQHDNDLYLSGQLDGDTWKHMFPPNPSLGYVDYDSDGIASPKEIGHWSGAFLGGYDPGPFDAPTRAVKRDSPTVVGYYCAFSSTGVYSSWKGKQWYFHVYEKLSNGGRQIVSSTLVWGNYANGPTQCPNI